MAAEDIAFSLAYSDLELRNLIEEFLVQQKSAFALKNVCSFILYWAIDDGINTNSIDFLIESYRLQDSDIEKVKQILNSIVQDGRLVFTGGLYFKL